MPGVALPVGRLPPAPSPAVCASSHPHLSRALPTSMLRPVPGAAQALPPPGSPPAVFSQILLGAPGIRPGPPRSLSQGCRAPSGRTACAGNGPVTGQSSTVRPGMGPRQARGTLRSPVPGRAHWVGGAEVQRQSLRAATGGSGRLQTWPSVNKAGKG